jgi:hypothetical protein
LAVKKSSAVFPKGSTLCGVVLCCPALGVSGKAKSYGIGLH